MAAIGGIMITFLVLGITGIVDARAAIPLLFLQFLGLVVAGYVAGRLAGRDRILHGSLASMLVYLVSSAIGLAISGSTASVLVLLFSGAVAAVLGSAGGALAEWPLNKHEESKQEESD
ncbi:MAG: hypothetical protein ACR2NL_12785 [Acidimicrobiia bacterium]